MNSRQTHTAPKKGCSKCRPAERQEFCQRLHETRRGSAADSLFMLLRGVRARKLRPSLPTPTRDFIEAYFPLCFADLPKGKREKLSPLSGWIADLSFEILKHEQGARVFEWAMRRSVEIAHQEKGDILPQAITSLFEASLKISAMGTTMLMGKEALINKFFSAYDRLPATESVNLSQEIANSTTHSKLRAAVNKAHSRMQELGLSAANPITGPSTF